MPPLLALDDVDRPFTHYAEDNAKLYEIPVASILIASIYHCLIQQVRDRWLPRLAILSAVSIRFYRFYKYRTEPS